MPPRMATNAKRNQPTLLVIAAAVMNDQTCAGVAGAAAEPRAGHRKRAGRGSADNNKVDNARLFLFHLSPPASAKSQLNRFRCGVSNLESAKP